jgi:DNA modification methylase
MLSMFFINDASNVGDWRLKKHAEGEFWRFVGSWAVMLQRPDNIGFNGDLFRLPKKTVKTVLIDDKMEKATLFSMPANGLSEMRASLKESMVERCEKVAELVRRKPNEKWLIWCQFNDEGDLLEKLIDGSIQIKGADTDEHKEKSVIEFANGGIRILISKIKITGFGVNWQSCHNVVFCGLSFSYEGYYQAIRRCWRFGQKEDVDIWCVLSEREIGALETIRVKELKHIEMNSQIINSVKSFFNFTTMEKRYNEDTVVNDRFTAMMGDSVERIKELKDESVDFMVFSPPFSDLYTYSDSERDMGNSKNDDEFYTHFGFLAKDLLRVLKSGRNMSVHCMNLSHKKFKDGFIGMKDFRGDLIRLFEKAGFIYYSEVTIWKDPVIQMQRTKALTLLHKQIKKDSSKSAQGYAEYLITFKKPGENKEPITHTADDFPVALWQQYASPVWMDIVAGETLQKLSAREDKDEKHICPLQLDVIRRAIYLWSNSNDVVLSPFMGIGSEGYVALECGRRFIGCELKKSYFGQAVKNLENALNLKKQLKIF